MLYAYRLDLLYKHISLANIAVARPNGAEELRVFLLSWQTVRAVNDATDKARETSEWKRIYYHSERQNEVAQETYEMGHDIVLGFAC